MHLFSNFIIIYSILLLSFRPSDWTWPATLIAVSTMKEVRMVASGSTGWFVGGGSVGASHGKKELWSTGNSGWSEVKRRWEGRQSNKKKERDRV